MQIWNKELRDHVLQCLLENKDDVDDHGGGLEDASGVNDPGDDVDDPGGGCEDASGVECACEGSGESLLALG